MRFFKKSDLIIVLVLLILGITLGVLYQAIFSQKAVKAEIYYGSELVKTVALDTGKDERFTVPQNDDVVFHLYKDGIVMYALFFLNKRQAFIIAVLKSVFVYATRGAIAGILSLCGGTLSLAAMTLLVVLFREKISYLVLSIFGAVFHNIGQLAAVSALYTSLFLWAYLPVLLIFGVIAGIATSTLLRFILPAFKRLA